MERNSKRFESVYSKKVRAGKRRTYYFDVRTTKSNDYYLTLTEKTRRFPGDRFERHKIFIYKEDFNRFLNGLEDVINHVKTELLPDYDYDEFTRRQEEYEAQQAEENADATDTDTDTETETESSDTAQENKNEKAGKTSEVDEEDMSW